MSRFVTLPKWEFHPLPKFRYRVIHVDPNWQFATYSEKGLGRSAQMHYHCDPIEIIKSYRVNLLAPRDGDCVLFLWCTSPMLMHLIPVIEDWGFKFSGKAFCWAKCTKQAIRNPAPDIRDNHNWKMITGYSTRSNTEDCWLATRGSPSRLSKGVRELIVDVPRDHSRKPDEVYNRIERLYPGPYVDLFSRCDRPGWDSWGDEAGKFNQEKNREMDSGTQSNSAGVVGD